MRMFLPATILLALLGASNCVVADTTTAVWYGEIWKYGIVTTGTPEDTLYPMVQLYAKPGEFTVVDSLRVGSAVKYERLSELSRIAPINLLVDEKLKGEWFQIGPPASGGWLPEKCLMTLLGADWGSDPTRHWEYFAGGHMIAVYVSGQFWISQSAAVTLWMRDHPNNRWILSDVILDALACGLYMGPVIDSFVYTPTETMVYLTSAGGDAGDIWGEYVTCRIAGDSLSIVHRESFHEESEY